MRLQKANEETMAELERIKQEKQNLVEKAFDPAYLSVHIEIRMAPCILTDVVSTTYKRCQTDFLRVGEIVCIRPFALCLERTRCFNACTARLHQKRIVA